MPTAGATAVNRALQDALNLHGAPLRQGDGLFDRESPRFRIGDKVMQRRNDYEKGVFNGDIGRIAASEAGSVRVVFDGELVEYADEELYGLDLAYALSVHKSQAPRAPLRCVLLPRSRNLEGSSLGRGSTPPGSALARSRELVRREGGC